MYDSPSGASSEDEIAEVISRVLRAHHVIMAGFDRLLASVLGSGQTRLAAVSLAEALIFEGAARALADR